MSEHAVKDDDAVKLQYLQRQFGVFNGDLENFGDQLQPVLPVALRSLKLGDNHFESSLFSPEKKLKLMSSITALIAAQQKVEDTNQLGLWVTRHSQDPSDKSHYRPLGFRESM